MAKKDNNNNNEEEHEEEKNENKIWKELEEEIKEISEKEEISEEEEIKIILPEPEPQHEPELEVIEEKEEEKEIEKKEEIKKESYLYYMVYDENISLESLIDVLKSGNFIVIDIPQKIDIEKFKEFLFRLKDSIDEIGGDMGWIENKKVILLSPNTIIKL